MKVTHVKPNELSGGKAGAPIQSKSSTAAGFEKGFSTSCCTSKAVGPSPGNESNISKPRKGVWHPAAEKP